MLQPIASKFADFLAPQWLQVIVTSQAMQAPQIHPATTMVPLGGGVLGRGKGVRAGDRVPEDR